MFHCCKGHRDCWNHFTYITSQTTHQYQQVDPFGLKSPKARVLMRAFERLLSNHLSAPPNGNHKADKKVRCFLQSRLSANGCSSRDQAGTSQFKKANPVLIPAQEMFLLAHAESWMFS